MTSTDRQNGITRITMNEDNEEFLYLSSFHFLSNFFHSSEVGKGWFSIHETNPDTYRQAPLNAWESYGLFHVSCLKFVNTTALPGQDAKASVCPPVYHAGKKRWV